ncbi:MAG TPA: hypothetical protein VLD37_05195 [Candidatus Bilamarchaeum sp.]|nr:hypothetical protein [Candidatus Bilamarchaeum sp.]
MNPRSASFIRTGAICAAMAASFVAGRHCPATEEIVRESGTCRLSEAESESARFVELIAMRAVRKSAFELRHELKAGIIDDLQISYSIAVSEDGRLGLKSARVSCAMCSGESELPEIIGRLVVNEFGMIPRRDSCTFQMVIPVPALGAREEGPAFRLPDTPTGMEL